MHLKRVSSPVSPLRGLADEVLGHEVTAVVRKADAVEKHPNLTVVQGDVLSKEDIDRAFKARGKPVEAAISFLNAPPGPLPPWSRSDTPPRLLADSVANLAQALKEQQVRNPLPDGRKPRLLPMNTAGSGESYYVLPWVFRAFIACTSLSRAFKDHDLVDREIESNCGDAITWTVPLPVGLGDAGNEPVKTFAPTEKPTGFKITRESAARWIIDVAVGTKGNEFDNKHVIMCN